MSKIKYLDKNTRIRVGRMGIFMAYKLERKEKIFIWFTHWRMSSYIYIQQISSLQQLLDYLYFDERRQKSERDVIKNYKKYSVL